MDVYAVWRTLVDERGRDPLGRPELPVPQSDGVTTLVDLGRQLHRALWWAKLDGWGIRIVDGRNPAEQYWGVRPPDLELVGVESRCLVFQVARLAREDVLLAAVCHEVARAYVAVGGPDGPYRVSGDALAQWSSDLELRASVASVFLGFGAVLASARRALLTHAIQSRHEIEPKERPFFGTLTDDELALLNLTRRGASSATAIPDVPPPPAELLVDLELAEGSYRRPMAGKPTRRLHESSAGAYGLAAGVLGIAPGVIMSGYLGLGLVGAGVVVGAGLVGSLIGRLRRRLICGNCRTVVKAEDQECSRCGAKLMTG